MMVWVTEGQIKETKPVESELRGKGCGKTRRINLRYDKASKTLVPL